MRNATIAFEPYQNVITSVFLGSRHLSDHSILLVVEVTCMPLMRFGYMCKELL